MEKILGAKEVCGFCHNVATCGSVTYQGETKLQWQNPDGKAHYKPNKGGCNVYQQAAPGFPEVPGKPGTPVAEQFNELEAVVEKVEVGKSVNDAVAEWKQIFYTADQLTHTINPNLKKGTNTYGQIRSVIATQLIALITKV